SEPEPLSIAPAAAACAQPQALVLRQGDVTPRPAAGRAAGRAQWRAGHAVRRLLEPDPIQFRPGAAALPGEAAALRVTPNSCNAASGRLSHARWLRGWPPSSVK